MVTGVGAVIGQGIVRSLKTGRRGLRPRIVGIDANPFSVGFQWVDASYTVPRVTEGSWPDAIADICRRENIGLILPGIEQDVKAFLENLDRLAGATDAQPLLNTPELLSLGFDKWELYLFAKKHGIEMPDTSPFDPDPPAEMYPLLLKPRAGMAGKGIYRVNGKEELDCLGRLIDRNAYILQRHVGTDEEEYTVSVFGLKGGDFAGPFALRRKLSYGSTFEAETVEDPALSEKVRRIAGLLRPIGPTNFQFRKDGDTYYLLEINPRFSSSTSIKSAFGFNEPMMAVKVFFYGRKRIRLRLKSGRASRYIADHVTCR